MFEEMLKTLKKLGNSVYYETSIEVDEDGYIDKECPNDKCLSKFKVKADDWCNLVSDEEVHCPYCGHIAPANSWYTTEQIEEAKSQAIQSVKNQLGEAIRKDARKFNAKPKTGFVSMSLKVSGWEKQPLLPIKALALMEQKLVCPRCGCSYSVIGSSTFCPCCGYSSIQNTFKNCIETVRSKLKLYMMPETVYEGFSKDAVADVKQSLLRSSLIELVGAFQVLCAAIFSEKYPSVSLSRNVFQRLDDGNSLWRENAGIEYTDWLFSDEMYKLKMYFQQRHLLEHNGGIIDESYIRKSGDTSYVVGQQLIVKEHDVAEFLDIICKLGNGIIESQLNSKKRG